jgi:hypothetical protein
MESTLKQVATAPRIDQASLRFGFFGVAKMSREARLGIKTVRKGFMEKMVSMSG